jgi:hypothetical protein
MGTRGVSIPLSLAVGFASLFSNVGSASLDFGAMMIAI